MCGIAGIYCAGNYPRPELVRRMTECLRHRGPDDEGYLAVNTQTREVTPLIGDETRSEGEHVNHFLKKANLFFGHRRLAILDLSPAGRQPMCSNNGSLWVVYNGEIYNYLELRRELKALGYEFRTKTDTEVLLTAYEAWGERCLDKFNGMWAFVIYDARKNILFGARDRFGVKPLYYFVNTSSFAFASEIKALLTLPVVGPSVNQKAVFDYLALGISDGQVTGFFNDISELRPSFAFVYDLGEKILRTWRYYELPLADRSEEFEIERVGRLVEDVRNLVVDAVRLRLRSDVPIGSCLSGGLDSSTIVCIANNLLDNDGSTQLRNQQRVFTASYSDGYGDESRWAREVVLHIQALWHQSFYSSDQLLKDIEEVVYTQDLPFATTSVFAQFALMRLARETGVKVLLDGQGGDELFAGYRGYHVIFILERLRGLRIFDAWHEIRNLRNSPIDFKFLLYSSLKMSAFSFLPASMISRLFFWVRPETRFLNRDFWETSKYRLASLNQASTSCLNESLRNTITGPDFQYLLRYEDRNSMRFSIEARMPFADDIRLTEYVFSIPGAYKIHDGWGKYLLREAGKEVLPDKIRNRRDKVGFATPERQWLSEAGHELRDYFTDDLREYLEVDHIRTSWDELLNRRPDGGTEHLWRLLNFAVWKKMFAKKLASLTL